MSGQIRLAHVCSSDLSIPALWPFCAPLLERGWQVTFITPTGPHVAPGQAAGLRWLPLDLKRRIDLVGDLRGSAQLAGHLLRERFDIVHTHNIKVGHIGRVIAGLVRVPIVVHTIHGMAFSLETPVVKRTVHAVLERVASLGCDLVFSQSREDLETYRVCNVIAPERVLWIGNGIDLSRFDPRSTEAARSSARSELQLSDEEILFFSAGRLIVEKGFIELFEATEQARRVDPRIRLAVAGPEDERADALSPTVLTRARDQGVMLLGRRQDMPSLYAASDVVVLASWHEGVPRVLMEGAAMGKPLLASDVRGCREVITPPRNGRLVPVRNASALAAAMIELAADERTRVALGRENAVEARDRYAVERSVAIVNDSYCKLLEQAGIG